MERLQIAFPSELAVNGLNFNHWYLGGLHSAYVRGLAFIAARRYAEAAAEFQKILDHRGIVGADPIGAAADTVADPAEVESELRFLAAVLTRK